LRTFGKKVAATRSLGTTPTTTTKENRPQEGGNLKKKKTEESLAYRYSYREVFPGPRRLILKGNA